MSTLTTGVSNVAQYPSNLWSLGGYTFDAWLRLNHQTSLTITQHPVEVGASVSDHSFSNQRRFSFDIGSTDTVGSSVSPGATSRSINAYRLLTELQASRQPLQLVSKYGTYDNILIENIDVPDDFRTRYAMKATVTLLQLNLVNTRYNRVSTNQQATSNTNRGTVAVQSINGQIVQAVTNYLGGLFR